MITGFQSVLDETSFVERIAAMRAAIFESDDRAVNLSKENHGFIQQDAAQWDVARFRAPKPRYTSNFLETSKNSHFSEPVACSWITDDVANIRKRGCYEGFTLGFDNFWRRVPLDKLACQPNSRRPGMLWLVERIEFLRLRDTPQGVMANRHQPLPIRWIGHSDKRFREQYGALDRTTHRSNAALLH